MFKKIEGTCTTSKCGGIEISYIWVDPDLSYEMEIVPQEKGCCRNHHKNEGSDTV